MLTTARLTRVLTHCTWENTTVAISKCGSKVGRYASSVCMPFLGCMVRRCGGECWCVVAFSRRLKNEGRKIEFGEIGVIVKIIVTDFYSYVQRQMVYV